MEVQLMKRTLFHFPFPFPIFFKNLFPPSALRCRSSAGVWLRAVLVIARRCCLVLLLVSQQQSFLGVDKHLLVLVCFMIVL